MLTPRWLRVLRAACGASLLAAWSTPAAAGDEVGAQALFDEAKRLSAAGRYAEACPKLAESQRIDPSGGTLLHLATCHENEGKTATAWTEFNEALSWARRDGRADRETFAKSHIEILSAKLVKLTVSVPDGSRAAGLSLKRDGAAVGEPQWGIAVPVDPGEHTLVASAPGRRAWTHTVRVDDKTGNVTVTLPALAAEPTGAPKGPAGPEPSREPPSSSSSQRTIGVLLGAVGLVGLGVGTAFELSALSKASTRDDAARRGDATTAVQAHDDAKSAQTLAFVSGGVGAAALVAGAVLFFTAPKSETPRVGIAPRVGNSDAGLFAVGRF